MDRETERNGTGQIPPVRLTACTIPSRFYGRPDICGDQRSISRQSKRDEEANRGPAHAYKDGKTKRAAFSQRQDRAFSLRRKTTFFCYIYVRIPILFFSPFSYLFLPMFPFSAFCRTDGEEEEEEGQQHTGAHAEEEEEERDTERSDIMKLVREREGCPEWDGPLPLSPGGAGPPMSQLGEIREGDSTITLVKDKKQKCLPILSHFIQHLEMWCAFARKQVNLTPASESEGHTLWVGSPHAKDIGIGRRGGGRWRRRQMAEEEKTPPEKGTKIKEVEEALLYYYNGTLVRTSSTCTVHVLYIKEQRGGKGGASNILF